MTTLLASVLVMGLLGSLHCAAMCGGLVGFVAGSGASGPAGPLLSHTSYQLGRLSTYAALGAAAGWVGKNVDLFGRVAGFANAAAVLAALWMVAWGVSRLLTTFGLGRRPKVTLKRRPSTSAWFTQVMHRAAGQSPLLRAATLGLLTGALPCGWLYAFVVMAAGTGSVASGVLVMATFWLSGVPALLGASVLLSRLARLLGKRLPAVSALVLVLGGLGTLATRALVTAPANPSADPATCPLHGSMSADSSGARP